MLFGGVYTILQGHSPGGATVLLCRVMNSIGVSRDINSGYSTRLASRRLGSTVVVRQQTLTSVASSVSLF